VRFILFVGCVALALGVAQFGCGGAKPDAAAPATSGGQASKASRNAAADTRPVIVAFGDSLTAGFGAEPGSSYADFLQKDLDRAGSRWRVVNAGVSGDTTTDGVNRLSSVLEHKPAVVILEFGGNDGLRGLPLETTQANLDRMVVALRGSGATVLLAGMTLPPNYGPEYIHGFEQIYSKLAAKYKLARIPFLLEGVALDRGLMQRDGMHPTAKGNERVAETVMKYLRPLLR
jgi:acyl-CoA thioesterase-1